jgi:hypothetical protein
MKGIRSGRIGGSGHSSFRVSTALTRTLLSSDIRSMVQLDRIRKLVTCRRDNVTADAAGRIGIFPLNLPELLHDAADSG